MSFLNISGEFLIVFLCLIQTLLKKLKKPPQQRKIQGKIDKLEESTTPPPRSIQLQQLLSRKKEIEDTVEELNNPSTFAKYSKMKRQLIKIQAKIKEITSEHPNSKLGQKESAQPEENIQKEQEKKEEYLFPSWFFLLFNIFIICFSCTMRTSVLPNSINMPISWLVDQEGRANCILVYFSCKMILN